MADVTQIGLIGCGDISREYMTNLKRFSFLVVSSCFDTVRKRATVIADRYGATAVRNVHEILTDDGIELVLNLTPAKMHVNVTLEALAAGKHVYSEKPLAGDLASARRIIDTAKHCGLRVGCAPDIMLGGPLRLARSYLRGRRLGDIVAADATFHSPGPEHWHENPAGFYERGSGPLFDMAPYFLTAMTWLLGPVAAVLGRGRRGQEKRRVQTGPQQGKWIDVKVLTHVASVVEFESGVVANITTSFDIPADRNVLELHGSAGSIRLLNLGRFGRPVLILPRENSEWFECGGFPPTPHECRGMGVAEMVMAIRRGHRHQASADRALHVVEVMAAIRRACATGRCEPVNSRIESLEGRFNWLPSGAVEEYRRTW